MCDMATAASTPRISSYPAANCFSMLKNNKALAMLLPICAPTTIITIKSFNSHLQVFSKCQWVGFTPTCSTFPQAAPSLAVSSRSQDSAMECRSRTLTSNRDATDIFLCFKIPVSPGCQACCIVGFHIVPCSSRSRVSATHRNLALLGFPLIAQRDSQLARALTSSCFKNAANPVCWTSDKSPSFADYRLTRTATTF